MEIFDIIYEINWKTFNQDQIGDQKIMPMYRITVNSGFAGTDMEYDIEAETVEDAEELAINYAIENVEVTESLILVEAKESTNSKFVPCDSNEGMGD